MAAKYGIQLTDAIQADICAYIRAGGFPHVAAEAAGVPLEVFQRWMELGAKPRFKKHQAFRLAVIQAQAQARLSAEMTALKEDPVAWLKSGPGKELPGVPGWAAPPKPASVTNDNRTVNIFGNPELLVLLHTLRGILAPYPEALEAVSAAMQGKTLNLGSS
jgi:hypothetical protein